MGAGLSAGEPTSLPGGAGVAADLGAWAAGVGIPMGGVADPQDLGEVAQAVEDATDEPTLSKQLLDLEPWSSRPFNLAHLSIALLYSEGLLTVSFTANWDPQVKRAAETIEGMQLSCPCNVPTLQVSSPPTFTHIHGCVEDPAKSHRYHRCSHTIERHGLEPTAASRGSDSKQGGVCRIRAGIALLSR